MREQPQYYQNIGYEDHGYVSPELSSSDPYPDYIKDEVNDSVQKIQEHQTPTSITFAFMTDLHYATSFNHHIRLQRTINAYREIKKRAHMDKLVLGGDYTNEGCKDYKKTCFRELRAHFDGIEYFPVNGNHDDGTIWDISYIQSDQSVNHLTHYELYSLFYNHLPSIGATFDAENHSLYYLYNDPVTKTRYVFLDTGDIPYRYDSNGKLLYSAQWMFALSQQQINWLVNQALKFEETGWSIALFAHSMPFETIPVDKSKDLWKYVTVLSDILEAFNTAKACKNSYYDGDFERQVNVDFSNTIQADVIGFFVGDHHYDEVKKSESGIPYIATANAVMYCTNAPRYVKRRDNDKSELLFDIMTVEKEKRKIFITRVGAGEDRIISY